MVARIGEGGMGAVYLARDPEGRPVAIKVIRPDLAPDERFRARHGNAGTVTTLASAPHRSEIGAASHEITIFADASQADVSVDGSEVLRGPLIRAALVSGKVTFGALKERGDARARIVFHQAVLRSGGPAPLPLPAFLHGDATFDARVHYLNEQTHAAIIEPADPLSGREFRRRHQVDAGSARCAAAAVLDPQDLTVTLPVSKAYRVREVRAGNSSCVDANTGPAGATRRASGSTSGRPSTPRSRPAS
jgi:hypothetical protein